MSESNVLPSALQLENARQNLPKSLPELGMGEENTLSHIRNDICPALNGASRSPHYYGFVTGGTTPVAAVADNIVTEYDNSVQVHLPNETIATEVEDSALSLLCELLHFVPTDWKHRTFTTGATASNILGLACGRQYVIESAAFRNTVKKTMDIKNSVNPSKVGITKALRNAHIDDIQILTTVPHSSLRKAASIVGLGRDSVRLTGRQDAPHKFDLELLEQELSKPNVSSIVAISCGDVNTGFFATTGVEMEVIRKLCDRYYAWIHVDGAFGLMACALDANDLSYKDLTLGCAAIHLANSITGDAHKLLNVPYDCGFFFSRDIRTAFEVFQNEGAVYLSTGGLDENAIQSPLHIGIENSRRFRALPVYAMLLSLGRAGYRDMLQRQIRLARAITIFLAAHEGYETLPADNSLEKVFMIVLFKAKDPSLNDVLVNKINATSKIYVSGTAWDGKPACRFAVSNWQVDVERDIKIIKHVLDQICALHTH